MSHCAGIPPHPALTRWRSIGCKRLGDLAETPTGSSLTAGERHRPPRPDAPHSRPANDERGLLAQAPGGGRSVWNLLPLIPRRSAATGATIVGMIVEFMDNDKGYVAWLAEHPNGYVLNCERPPRPSGLTLHRATCWTISRASGSNWTVNYQKVCADTFEEINAWASQIGPPWCCGFCAHS